MQLHFLHGCFFHCRTAKRLAKKKTDLAPPAGSETMWVGIERPPTQTSRFPLPMKVRSPLFCHTGDLLEHCRARAPLPYS